MKKIKLKKKIRFNSFNIVISISLVLLLITLIFNYINKKASPIIMEYATLEAQKLSSIIINKAVSKHITEKINSEDIYEITKDESGEIKAIDFNTTLINKFLTETTNSVQMNLKNIENGKIDAIEFGDSIFVDYDKKKLEEGIIYEISSGVLFGNPVLANTGPKIPIKISIIGDAISNVSTNVKNYGINNALIEVFVNIKIKEKIILPFYNNNIEIKTKVPVALKIVTGTVPKYYGSSLNQDTPSLAIPIEENN